MREWENDAACRDMDPDKFFVRSNRGQRMVAARVCHGMACPVMTECLDDALRNAAASGGYGVRGGMSEDERRSLRRRLGGPNRRDEEDVA